MTLDEAIAHCLEVAEQNESSAITYKNCKEIKANMYEKLTAEKAENDCRECATDHRQLAEWLKELKDLREENKVLMQECDRLIKEKGELLSKVSGGDVLRICQLEEKLEKAKRLLKAAVEDMRWVNENTQDSDGTCVMRKGQGCGDCPLDINGDLWCKWKHESEALKLIGGEEDENSI